MEERWGRPTVERLSRQGWKWKWSQAHYQIGGGGCPASTHLGAFFQRSITQAIRSIFR